MPNDMDYITREQMLSIRPRQPNHKPILINKWAESELPRRFAVPPSNLDDACAGILTEAVICWKQVNNESTESVPSASYGQNEHGNLCRTDVDKIKTFPQFKNGSIFELKPHIHYSDTVIVDHIPKNSCHFRSHWKKVSSNDENKSQSLICSQKQENRAIIETKECYVFMEIKFSVFTCQVDINQIDYAAFRSDKPPAVKYDSGDHFKEILKL